MYRVVAEKGNLNVNLDLTDLINESKGIINDKETHNKKVLDKLDDLTDSYITELNKILEDNNIKPKFKLSGSVTTPHSAYRVLGLGHGLGSVKIVIEVNSVSKNGLYENNLVGMIHINKDWLYSTKDVVKESFYLESVGQVIEKGLDCIKINHLHEVLEHSEYDIVKDKFQY